MIDNWLMIDFWFNNDGLIIDWWFNIWCFIDDWLLIDDWLKIVDWLMIDEWVIDWWFNDDWLMIDWLMIDWLMIYGWLIHYWLMINGMALSQFWLCLGYKYWRTDPKLGLELLLNWVKKPKTYFINKPCKNHIKCSAQCTA